MPDWLPTLLIALLVAIVVILVLGIREARRRRTATLLRNLRCEMLAAGPDGRCVTRPLPTYLWQWASVSPHLLGVGVSAATSTLQGDAPVRAVEAEVTAGGVALRTAIREAASIRGRHERFTAHLRQVSANPALTALLPALTFPADDLFDAVSTGVEAGHLPVADLLHHSSLEMLSDGIPLLGVLNTATRTARRMRAGQDFRTASGVSVAETVGRSAGSLAAGKAGALAGSMFGPVGIVIGAGVGALMGGTIGHSLGQRGRRAQLCLWEADLETELGRLGAELAGTPSWRYRTQREVCAAHDHALATLQQVRQAARRRARHPRHLLAPDPRLVLLREVERYGMRVTRTVEREVAGLYQFVQEEEPTRVAALLARDPDCFERLGADPDRLRTVELLSDKVRTEQNLLG